MILLFTFHYGSIQMRPGALHSSGSRDSFTFHYGSIQMEIASRPAPGSNHFTFHYGSIQIGLIIVPHNAEYLFTFHYGSIQMVKLQIQRIGYPPLHSTMVLFKLRL